jgi:hypothetical protein
MLLSCFRLDYNKKDGSTGVDFIVEKTGKHSSAMENDIKFIFSDEEVRFYIYCLCYLKK